ncbi:MAG: MtrB/PioB family outer membrane beta-barrel protein [Alphaproteobacteria bacterium]|uniref:MtrB/PioB family outer membrane beta-barrel protein n=1 Tax=Candidatus Nitrobium versatile TaxID=2884831 RepID=A0A953JA03_9BACT|nr:MtrB/PioB family outer membrane beta-barrel protein [Candidatus Nitrobium versatile]
MKIRTLLCIAAMSFACVSSAFAAESKLEGSVSLTGKIVDVNGSEAKFNEYRDLDDGVYAGIKLGYESGAYYTRFKALDTGYDTQSYKLDGGMWGRFKYDLFYNEIPHNFTYGARTFYSGAGTNNLTGTPNTNVSSWNTFDYSLERKSYGGGLSFDLMKPFFIGLSASREERTGIKPISAAIGSPGGAFVELPEPVDYTTNHFKAEAGYAKKPYFASLSYSYSNFENSNEFLNFQHPTSSVTDTLTLPPDNQYYKVAFKGAVDLPMKSRFNATLSSARAKSDADLLTSYFFEGASTATNLTLSDTVFNGEVKTQNYAFVLTSNPLPLLNAKVFYKYYEKENESDQITTTQDTDTFTNKLFDYRKNKAGVELGIKLPANFRLIPAYTYVKTNREREDIPETRDNILSLDLKWSGLAFMTAKIGYERLWRDADHGILTVVGGQDEADLVEQYVRRFDAAPKDQDTYKASVELYPLDNLGIGLGYKYRKADYRDTTLGLRDYKSNEFLLDADYSIGRIAKLNAYFDYERIKSYQFQRRYNPPSSGGDPNPDGTSNSTNYNWDVTQVDTSYNYGAGTDIYVLPRKLTLRVQFDHLDSDGHADFTYYTSSALTGGRTNDNIDSPIWDDYRKTVLMAKAEYNATKSLSLSAGYAYERYEYNDATLDGYLYTFGSGTNTNYLTGAYKDQSYNASIIFLTAAYKF